MARRECKAGVRRPLRVAGVRVEFQSEKDFVRRFHAALDAAPPEALGDVLAAHLAPGHHWRGVHPFGEIRGAEALAEEFWRPLRRALTSMRRRDDVFFAGRSHTEDGGGRAGAVWVVSMGHLLALFDAPWLGIRPTQRIVMLRQCTFHRVEGGRIAETTMHMDVPDLMMQAGLRPFPVQTGAHLVQPGPATQDGLLHGPQPPEEGERTLALIESMISDLGQWGLGLPLEEELRRSWAEDMLWWGPAGIGSTFTIPRYAEQHSAPFRAGFADRSPTRHVARLAEGSYGGFFGWPNFTARPTGGALGLPATGESGEFRVIDIYRRDGDRLAENWVFIDLLHFWSQQGVDVLNRTIRAEG